jgi:hypothetical protein
MANLIWPVEAVLLGVWGFILSVAYSTPFHQFISFTQLLISSTTLFFHALVASRAPTRALAVSQAHSCAIAALFLLYVAVLMHPSLYDVAFNSPTIFGPWPFAANIGLAWIMLILLGAIAMCIPDIIDNQRSALMLHPFGYHMLVAFPCMVVNSASSTPNTTNMSLYITVCIWWLYMGGEIIARCFYTPTVYYDEQLDSVSRQYFLQRLFHSCGYPIRRLQAIDDMLTEGIVSIILDLLSKLGLLTIVVITFLSTSGPPMILCAVLMTIACLHQVNWLAFVDWILGDYDDYATPIGEGWKEPAASETAVVEFKQNEPSAPPLNIEPATTPSAPTLSEIKTATLVDGQTATAARFRFPSYQQHSPPINLNLPLQWRDKAV